ncbi:MBL fold metallo-hydrolase [Halobellus ordinarius]|uniref:MBL fold metallo-hydrolase n=1 Tax=Halobellus ordinarius TaxID=3075120 RepID=UPI0028807461|nr:MBL fold metallo-hydrolase [Halobellus sp. ZY16]
MDVHRIPLGNNIFEGQNNAYLLDGEVTTLIDVGASMPAVRADLLDGLAAADVALSDLDRILLTHWHTDHCGLAGELQAETGAAVFAHEADVPLIAGDEDAKAAVEELRERRFREWGIPGEKLAELDEFRAKFETMTGEVERVESLREGDRVAAGDGELGVLHLPGHAAGQVGFTFERAPDGDATDPSREAFVGDAILPQYTPNVGGADLRVDRPLKQYVESLDRLIDCDFDRVWPGHRDPIGDPAARARVIRAHHVERTRRVVDVLREHGPADAWTVSAHLFGELENIHILHGPGEAFAHLDHLAHAGVVERDGDEYRLIESDPDVSELFPKTKY